MTNRKLRSPVAALFATLAIFATVACSTGEGDRAEPPTTEAVEESQNPGPNDVSGDVTEPVLVTEGTASYGEVTVTNSTSERSDYSITIIAESADGATPLSEADLYVFDLEPGQSKTDRGRFFEDVPADAVLKTEVERLPSV